MLRSPLPPWFSGAAMDNAWAKKLWDAQRQTTFMLNGRNYKRIQYGKERWGRDYADVPCHDCGARCGQLHVLGCDMERCPACRGQLISCRCEKETVTA